MSRIATLKDSRAKARKDLDKALKEADAILAERAMTPEEEEVVNAARSHFEQVETRYEEAKADEKRAQKEEAKRQELGSVRVGKEPLTYGPDNPQNSFYRDLLCLNDPLWQETAAGQRLLRHRQELTGIARSKPASPEARAIGDYTREVRRLRSVTETRDVSTETSSMGDFAPPLYFLTDWAPYRVPGRTLIDNLRKMAMPETGMVFNVPKITQPTEGVNQTTTTQGAGENTTVTTRTLTSTYEVGSLQTIIDNLLVSQQYLDRVGPGVGGDQIVRDDQQRQVNLALNKYAWKSIFKTATVSKVTYAGKGTTHTFTAATFNQTVHKAKAIIQRTTGIIAYPTHFVSTPDLWETVEGAFDSQNRPFVVPQGVAFNPLAVGDRATNPEGYTGFRFAAMQSFIDQGNRLAWKTTGAGPSAAATQHVSLVADLSIAAWWLESTPVVRVLPQPYAKTLTVLIQEYVYCAYIPQYPGAMKLVYGAGTAATKLAA